MESVIAFIDIILTFISMIIVFILDMVCLIIWIPFALIGTLFKKIIDFLGKVSNLLVAYGKGNITYLKSRRKHTP